MINIENTPKEKAKVENDGRLETVLGHSGGEYSYKEKTFSIEIYDNVFIGANTIICGNVKIGPNAVIGAGSVVLKNVPNGTVYAGVPAKQIGTFEGLMKKRLD